MRLLGKNTVLKKEKIAQKVQKCDVFCVMNEKKRSRMPAGRPFRAGWYVEMVIFKNDL